MTENNIFQEIEDDIERQKLEALWKRYGVWVIAIAFALVIGTAAYTAWHSWHTERNQQATAILEKLVNAQESDESKKLDALVDYAHKNNTLFQATIAQFYAAALAAREDKKDKAIEIYDAIAQDNNTDTAFRQLADLRSIELQLSNGDAKVLSKRLENLSVGNAPWHFTAMEYQGYLALRIGEQAKAREVFTALSQNAQVPKNLSQRASDILYSLAE